MSTNSRIASLLVDAQRDVRTAVGLTADPDRRVQYARAAHDTAAEILLDPDSSDSERAAARLCFNQALTLAGQRPRVPGQSAGVGLSAGYDIG